MTAAQPIEEFVAAVLASSQSPELRRLVVAVSEAEVVITGRVSSYYFKQLAQELLRSSIGERRLVNEVVVSPSALTPPPRAGLFASSQEDSDRPNGREPRDPPVLVSSDANSKALDLAAELVELEKRFPPPSEDAILADCRWFHEHSSSEKFAPYRGTHVAIYNGAVAGSGIDSLQLEIELARNLGVHPQRLVIVYIPGPSDR